MWFFDVYGFFETIGSTLRADDEINVIERKIRYRRVN